MLCYTCLVILFCFFHFSLPTLAVIKDDAVGIDYLNQWLMDKRGEKGRDDAGHLSSMMSGKPVAACRAFSFSRDTMCGEGMAVVRSVQRCLSVPFVVQRA